MSTNPQSDLTQGSIGKNLFRIALPASVGFFFNTMYNFVDTYFAGQLSDQALAALSSSFPLFIVVMALSIGLGTGTMALISNAIGAKEDREASHFQSQAIGLGVIVFILVSVPLIFALDFLFIQLGVKETSVRLLAIQYTRIIFIGGLFFGLNSIFNAGLNARGLTHYYRNTLIVGFLLNVGLDPLFMFGLKLGGVGLIPAMGVGGVAFATVLIQVFTGAYLLYNVRRNNGLRFCSFRDYLPRWHYARQIIKQSLPAILDFVAIGLGAFVIIRYVAEFGSNAVAGYGAGLRIEQIALIPSIGLNIALSAIVGQSNGAKKYDRIARTYGTSLLFSAFLMLAFVPLITIFRTFLIGIFTDNSDIIYYGQSYVLVQAIAHFSYILLFQSNAVLQSIKRPGVIFWFGLARQVILPALLFGLLISVLNKGIMGIWWGIVGINWAAALGTCFYTLFRISRLGKSDPALEVGGKSSATEASEI